jgi:hypothetical protein
MKKEDPKQRPSCDEILEEKHLWALNENELEIEKEIRDVLDSGLRFTKVCNVDLTHNYLE